MHHNTPFNPGFSHPRKMILTVQLIQRARVGTRDRLDAARMDLPDAAGLGALSPFMRSLRRCRWAFLRPRRLFSSLASSAVSLRLTRPLFMSSAQGIGAIIFVMKSANWRYVGTQRITTTLFSTKSLQMRGQGASVALVGSCPMVIMWSYKDLASVVKWTGTLSRFLHWAVTCWFPAIRMCSSKRTYRCLSAARHIEQDHSNALWCCKVCNTGVSWTLAPPSCQPQNAWPPAATSLDLLFQDWRRSKWPLSCPSRGSVDTRGGHVRVEPLPSWCSRLWWPRWMWKWWRDWPSGPD